MAISKFHRSLGLASRPPLLSPPPASFRGRFSASIRDIYGARPWRMGRTQKGRKMDNIAQKHYHNSSIVCGVALLMKTQSRTYRVTKSSGRLKCSPRFSGCSQQLKSVRRSSGRVKFTPAFGRLETASELAKTDGRGS